MQTLLAHRPAAAAWRHTSSAQRGGCHSAARYLVLTKVVAGGNYRPSSPTNGRPPSPNGSKKQLWIDCDAGIDDAQGLLLALAQPNIELMGISCVAGNVNVDQVAFNVARLLTLCERTDIPFYRGCSEPMLAAPIEAKWFHGRDGLGDVPEIYPLREDVRVSASPGMGPVKLVEAARQHDGRLHLVALGPLTNVALATKLDPTLPLRLASLTVMGGAESEGNESPAAEFNFYADPEAAAVVFEKFKNIQLVTWECTLRHSLQWPWVEEWLEGEGRRAEFMEGAMRHISANMMRDAYNNGWAACDAVAVACAVAPHIVEETRDVFCQVELGGKHTRGMSVFDVNNVLRQPSNTRLVKRLSMDAFKELLKQGVAPAAAASLSQG